MCGIIGLVDKKIDKTQAVKLVSVMTETLKHRGPDDKGVNWVGGNTYFGSRRLAVLDLSPQGHMPMKSLNGNDWITYNGEVYNYKSIKKDLVKKGYKFKSNSDTEVILNGYLDLKEKLFANLEGMFAIAIFSNKNKELVLARDHFGIKPLYYYFKDGVFAFASEIKALLKHSKIDREKSIDKRALNLYFSTGFGAIPAPYSIFKDIKKLPAGHYLKLKNNKIVIKKYWGLESLKKNRIISFDEATLKAKEIIEDSVSKQMMADVSVGCFLSGGIDSSLIASIMTKYTDKKIKTFSIGFKDKSFDESSHTSLMARILKSDHTEKTFGENELINSIDKIYDQLDEPMADASILPMYLLAKEARNKVTVALSGDGGDELFGGYPTYLAHKLTGLYGLAPKKIRKVLASVVDKLPASTKNISFDFKLKRSLMADLSHPALTHLDFMAPATIQMQKKLFSKDFKSGFNKKGIYDEFIDSYEEFKDADKQIRLQYLDLKYYLTADGLVKGDRASNMYSLEVRVPFLSKKLAELCFSLPGSYHYSRKVSKKLLKIVAQSYLPKKIINRPKKGFGVPMARWLKEDLNSMMYEYLDEKKLKDQKLFDQGYVKQLIQEHEGGGQNNRMILWSLIVFEYWYKKWFKT